MKFLFPAMLLACVAVLSAEAQNKSLVPSKTMAKVLELKMPRTADDDMPGTRGASVAWHPVQLKYYASFAGNVSYPMAVFDVKGKRLSPDSLNTMFDTRGLWYDVKRKKLVANGYDDFGWATYLLNSKGIPTKTETLFEGADYQPNLQSVGAYIPATDQVMFMDGSQLVLYKSSDGSAEFDAIALHPGITAKMANIEPGSLDGTLPEDYNSTAVYTGIKGAEIGLLNITENRVELYDIKKGYLVRTLKFPTLNFALESTFNFSFSNGMVWVFDITGRRWVAFK
jgi:hypothetical protein